MINSAQILGFLLVSGIFESVDRENSFSGEGGIEKVDLPQGDTASEDCFSEFGEPYKFTSKELDEETGLYYYGARYYDAKLSRWVSADKYIANGKYFPKPEDFDTDHDYIWRSLHNVSDKLPGMGGVFNSINLDAYQYGGDNPTKLIDPDGNAFIKSDNLKKVFSFTQSLRQKHPDSFLANAVAGFIEGQVTDVMPVVGVLVANPSSLAGKLVIGRGKDLAKPGALKTGEFKLKWPPTSTAKSEWKINSGLLRQEMNKGIPIRDASPGDIGGMYLNAERNLLENFGWGFNKDTNYWLPPSTGK